MENNLDPACLAFTSLCLGIGTLVGMVDLLTFRAFKVTVIILSDFGAKIMFDTHGALLI